METSHQIYFADSRKMDFLADQSVELVVTSPPYPMIQMWDETFSRLDPAVAQSLEAGNGWGAFEQMHRVLDSVWQEVGRVLAPGGFACINIGDAVRKIGDIFSLYPNHSRILQTFIEQGMYPLPAVLWRKQTNAPNKFMGSGMLPAGAYVTLEHEYVLIFRKGSRREFKGADQRLHRQQSAYFWEERNQWFSDVWFDLKGARQDLVEKKLRKRSGAFPFALPYRLINMYSVAGDTVLDPFAGTGTTLFAAMAAARNSAGVETEKDFYPVMEKKSREIPDFARQVIDDRLRAHMEFAAGRKSGGKPLKYTNSHYGFAVMTRQEIALR
ncbi:MAG: site-specific DNA-methyltransferase, partial [Desulfobacterales bacterium]|nr:site-specific DNA-methyltransferase [Desulfobacterales bacterium]